MSELLSCVRKNKLAEPAASFVCPQEVGHYSLNAAGELRLDKSQLKHLRNLPKRPSAHTSLCITHSFLRLAAFCLFITHQFQFVEYAAGGIV
jgi:hypothetical protein